MPEGNGQRPEGEGGALWRLHSQSTTTIFEPEESGDGCGTVFLNRDNGPLTENAVKMVFERLATKAGIPRLHIHLLRHTMATNYLVSGENPIKLQRILGHETLEMTRRYADMVAVQSSITESRQSPVDRMHLKYGGNRRQSTQGKLEQRHKRSNAGKHSDFKIMSPAEAGKWLN